MSDTGKAPRVEPLDRCPFCASKRTTHFFTSPDRLHGTPGEFSYHLCSSCHSVFQNPMVIPEDLHLCYPATYTPYNYKQEIPTIDFDALPNGTLRNRLRKAVVREVKGLPVQGIVGGIGKILAKHAFFRERAFYGLVIDELLPKGAGKHIALDLGCGAGWLIGKLKIVGWEVEGVEWNEAAAQVAREVTGCKIWAGDVRRADIPKGRYHLIVLNHVFEHFSDPKEVLVILRELLTDNGKVVMFYPNPHSFGAQWHKTNWFPWEIPRHLIFPTSKAVKIIASRVGFSEATVFTRSYCSSVQWISSKAYKYQQHPDKVRPDLDLVEKAGLLTERILGIVGLEKGCETIVVLRK